MLKIKLNLFEAIIVSIMLPNAGLFFTTCILIISLIVKQEPIVYKAIVISYIVCIILLIVLVLFCFLINKTSKKEIVLYDDKFIFLQREYLLEQIVSCKYYVCKWYAIPFAIIYKQQVGGVIEIKLNTGEKITFQLFYGQYLKLKKYIQNIIEE